MYIFYFKMLVENEFVEIFQIYYWAVPFIFFFYKEEFAQKLPLCGY